MKIKKLCIILIVALCFTGCTAADIYSDNVTNTYSTTDNTIPTVPSTAIIETTVATEPTVATTVPETTAPDLSLDIAPGRHQMRFYDEANDDYLDYHLFVPNNPQKNMPLIIFLHGMGEVDKIDELKSFGPSKVIYELYGEDFPFFLLMPCTHERTWSQENVPYTLKALIDTTISNLSSDTDHIILTGHSLGAIGTWKMISLYGNFFSAAVPVSCGIDEVLNFSNFHDIPIWGFVGTDGYYEENYNKAMVRIVGEVNAHGGNAELTIYDGIQHHETILLPYTRELFDWMLAQ